jgi:WD40 repeat protein
MQSLQRRERDAKPWRPLTKHKFNSKITTRLSSFVVKDSLEFICTTEALSIYNENKLIHTQDIHETNIQKIRLHKDKGLFTTSSLNALKVWSPEFEHIYTFKINEPLKNHILLNDTCILNIGRQLRICDLKSGASVQQLKQENEITCMSGCPFRDYLIATGDSKGMTELWDMRFCSHSFLKINTNDHIDDKLDSLSGIDIHDTDYRLDPLSGMGSMNTLKRSYGQPIEYIPIKKTNKFSRKIHFPKTETTIKHNRLNSVLFSKNGCSVYTTTCNKLLEFNILDQSLVYKFHTPFTTYGSEELLEDNEVLHVPGNNGSFYVYDIRRKALVETVSGHIDRAFMVLSDESVVYSGGLDGVIQWDPVLALYNSSTGDDWMD